MSSPTAPKKSVADIMDFAVAQAQKITDTNVTVTPNKAEGYGNNLVRKGAVLEIGNKRLRLNVREDTSRSARVTQESNPAKLEAGFVNSAALLGLSNTDVIIASGKYAGLPKAEQQAAEQVAAVRRSIEVIQPSGKRMSFLQTMNPEGKVDFVTQGKEPQTFSQWLQSEATASLAPAHGHGKVPSAQATAPR